MLGIEVGFLALYKRKNSFFTTESPDTVTPEFLLQTADKPVGLVGPAPGRQLPLRDQLLVDLPFLGEIDLSGSFIADFRNFANDFRDYLAGTLGTAQDMQRDIQRTIFNSQSMLRSRWSVHC